MRFRLPTFLALVIPSLCHASAVTAHPIVAPIAGEGGTPAATEAAAGALVVGQSMLGGVVIVVLVIVMVAGLLWGTRWWHRRH